MYLGSITCIYVHVSGESVGESSMSSSSIMCRCSSDEESLSCPSSITTRVGEKKTRSGIDLSGPGLRSRSQGPPDLRPVPDLCFSGHPDLRPYLPGAFARTVSSTSCSSESRCFKMTSRVKGDRVNFKNMCGYLNFIREM